MDEPKDYYAKLSEQYRDKYHVLSLIYGILKKNDTNELIFKIETDPQT